VEVLNFGCVGYTVLQGLELYRGRVRAYGPDVVLSAFGACNEQFDRESGLDDVHKMQITRTVPFQARMVLERYATFRFLDKFVDKLLPDPPRPPDPPSSGPDDFRSVRVTPAEFEDALAELDRLQREDGRRLAMICPPRMEVAERQYPKVREYERTIHRVADRLSAPLAEVRDPFREREDEDRAALGTTEYPRRARLFLEGDPYHPNAEGHQLYARIVQSTLETAGLLKEARSHPDPR
jgi:lysophospholipase L1-like esterase